MLTLLNYDESFIPAKRLFERKPICKVAFSVDDLVIEFETSNN